MNKFDKSLIEEFSWDDEDTTNDSIDKSASNPTAEAQKILKNLDSLDNLDKTFDTFFKNVLNTNDDVKIFSSKIQRMELNDLSKIISHKKEEKEDLNDYNESKEIKKDLEKLFNNESDDILKILQDQNIQNNRKELYELYDEIADINYIAYRTLRVYLDNLLVKNISNKDFLSIKENENELKTSELETSEKEFIKKYINMLLVFFNVQNKLKNDILPKMLKYGDFYIEIVNLSPISGIIKKQPEILMENFNYNSKTFKNIKYAIYESTIKSKHSLKDLNNLNENTDHLKGLERFKYQLKKVKENISRNRQIEEHDISLFNSIMEPEFNIKQFFNLDLDVIDDLYLRLHEPSNVLKVQRDGVLYGYLIIENLDEENDNESEVNIYKRFLSDNEGDYKNKTKKVSEEITEEILRKMAEDLNDLDLDSFNDDLKISLKIIIYQKLLKKQKMKFRFIDPQDLINFHTVIDKFSPYGTSIFDSIVQPVKMYTIGLMTSIVSRLSRASVVRKWNIEVGNRRNYQTIVEQVKKDLRDKSVSFDSLSSIKNISKIVTDYKDIATVTRDGQRFIDLEILPLHDRSLPIQELQDLRQELIAATGVPAVYLNMADAVDLRETLVNLNINFANQIITLQSFIEDALNDLLNSLTQKILELNGIETKDFLISNYFKITMNPPLVLQLQQNEALVGSVVNIIGALAQAQMPVDPVKLFEMYIPQVNWNQLKKSGDELVREEMKKQLLQQGQSGSQQGGF